jgi:hypothetical protein
MEKEIIRQSGIDRSFRCFVTMKILISSTNVPDHLDPLLAVADILRQHNHEVVVGLWNR